MSSASTGNGKEFVIIAMRGRAPARVSSIFGGVARRPASHARYDSGDAPSINCERRLRLTQRDPALTQRAWLHDVTPCHQCAGRREARGWRGAYFSQPIFEA